MSIESMTLGLRSEIEADAGLIRNGTFELDSLRATMLGDSSEVASQFETTSGEFTDLIAWDIRGVGQDELESWQRTSRNLVEGSTALNLWADAIDEYKRERSRIEEDWEEEKAAAISRVESAAVDANESTPMALSGFIGVAIAASAIKGREAREAEQIEYLDERKAELRAEHDTAWENLMDAADDCKRNLRDGLDQEALEEAIDRGLLTWTQLGWYGSDAPLPVDSGSGSSTAETIAEYVENPEGYEGDVDEVLAMIAAVNAAALRHQKNGTELHPNEMEFLDSLYDSLEENRAGERIPGVLGISDDIVNSDEIDPDLQELMLGALGDGILAVSDETLGGGIDNLPESIRNTSLGPDPMEEFTNEQEHFGRADWTLNAAFLSDLFEHTNPDLQGGAEFSANLTATVGFELGGGESGDDPINTEEWAETLIATSSRNIESNYDILTGEVSEDHPIHRYELPFEETQDSASNRDVTGAILNGLFGHDWHSSEDYSGDATDREVRNEAEDSPARALTDWISEWAASDDEEKQQMAAEASYGLVTSLNGGPESDLRNTEIEIDGRTDTSFTQVNPGIAESISDVYFTYFNSFGLDPNSGNSDVSIITERQANGLPFFDEGSHALHFSREERESFFQFLIANEDLQPNIMGAAIAHERAAMEAALFEGGYPPEAFAESPGNIVDMIERALLDEYHEGVTGAEEMTATERAELATRWEVAYKVAAAAASGGVGVVNAPAGTMVGMLGILGEEPLKDFLAEYAEENVDPTEATSPPPIRMERREDAVTQMTIHAANVLADRGIVPLEEFINAGVTIENEDGSHRLPLNSGEIDLTVATDTARMREIIDNVSPEDLDGVDEDTLSTVTRFTEAYANTLDEKNT